MSGVLGPVPEHGQALRPRQGARATAARTPVPARTRGPLPRLPAQAKREEEPGVPVQRLLREIREQGYPGSSNLLVRYINQGRLDTGRPHIAPRKATQILLTNPDNLPGGHRETAGRLSAACPEMKALARLIGKFAAMLDPDPANDDKLLAWIAGARAADLPLFPLLHPRPGTRHQGRQRRSHAPVPQRANRRSEQQDENDQKADVRARRLRPSPPPDTPRMKPERHHRKCDRALLMFVPVLHHIPDYMSFLRKASQRIAAGGALLTL